MRNLCCSALPESDDSRSSAENDVFVDVKKHAEVEQGEKRGLNTEKKVKEDSEAMNGTESGLEVVNKAVEDLKTENGAKIGLEFGGVSPNETGTIMSGMDAKKDVAKDGRVDGMDLNGEEMGAVNAKGNESDGPNLTENPKKEGCKRCSTPLNDLSAMDIGSAPGAPVKPRARRADRRSGSRSPPSKRAAIAVIEDAPGAEEPKPVVEGVKLLSQPELDGVKPLSQAEVDEPKPLSQTETGETKPLSQTEVDEPKPLSQADAGETKPLSQTETGETKPPSQTEADETKPLSQSQADEALSQDEPNEGKPLSSQVFESISLPNSPPVAPLVPPVTAESFAGEASPEPVSMPKATAPSCTPESPLVTPDRESQDDASLSPQRRSPRHETTDEEDEPMKGTQPMEA